jgi:hypothetical protein
MGSQPPTENDPKGGESESDDRPTLDKFNSLAKGLFGVAREDLEKAEKRFKDRERRAMPQKPD